MTAKFDLTVNEIRDAARKARLELRISKCK